MNAKLQNTGPVSLCLCLWVAQAEVETRWNKADGYSAFAKVSTAVKVA